MNSRPARSVVGTWTWFRSRCTCQVSLQRLTRRHSLPSTGSLGLVPPLPRYYEMLRLPAAHFAVLRFLRLAIPSLRPWFVPPGPDAEPWINLELGGADTGQTEFQVNLKLGLTLCPPYAPPETRSDPMPPRPYAPPDPMPPRPYAPPTLCPPDPMPPRPYAPPTLCPPDPMPPRPYAPSTLCPLDPMPPRPYAPSTLCPLDPMPPRPYAPLPPPSRRPPGPAGSGPAQTLPRWLLPDTDRRIAKD